MTINPQQYPLLHDSLVGATATLSALTQQLNAQPTMDPVMQAVFIDAITEHTSKLGSALWRQNYENEKLVRQQKMQLSFARHPIRSLADLEMAPLKAKREILNAMAIVPVTVAAWFLGVPKHTIYDLPYHAGISPWPKYLNVQAMSVDQIMLLATNPKFYDRHYVEIAPQAHCKNILDHSIEVNEETAQAIINVSYAELLTLTKRTYLYRPRFRLAELEKIRAEKLNQVAASPRPKGPSDRATLLEVVVL